MRAENIRLVALLQQHGISSQEKLVAPKPESTASTNLSSEEKIALFRRLFRGRTDVYPLRWESKAGRAGYTPACGNEWRAGVCEKPRIKCADCGHRLLLPVTDAVIYSHLAGEQVVGVYPLLPNDTCCFLAVDFDDDPEAAAGNWRDDARAFVDSCRELSVPVTLEISRSGVGAHAWIFFAAPVPARDARRLGCAIISRACALTRQLKLTTYDRLFPNQDTLPKGGFGNLIALPLQKKAREKGCSVFVDERFQPYADPWAYLASVVPMPSAEVEAAIVRATGGGHPLDVAFIADEDETEPWKRPAPSGKLPGPLPTALNVTLANQLYFEKNQIPQPLLNKLIRLAAFQNPEFYKAQAMRFPVWDKPRVIGCAENFPRHIALPRGCLDAVSKLLEDNGIALVTHDERFRGTPLATWFTGQLRPDQDEAVMAMSAHDIGVLCAPTAFGKTVTAAAIVARRAVNTLILVHRTELLKQWQERLRAFLDLGKNDLGIIGGGKHKPSGKIDVAVMQSLSRKGDTNDLIAQYGHIVVDECHHLSAVSFEALLKRAKARYVLGLTATPYRRDGQQPIIFLQCGPVRHEVKRSNTAPHARVVLPRPTDSPLIHDRAAGIQDLFRQLAADARRNRHIINDVREAHSAGRNIIVLTERTDHLERLRTEIAGDIANLFVLHGRLTKKQRTETLAALEVLPGNTPRVLLATGKLIGEGFDHAPLDTLMLAMPISWKGTLQQYAGRLHREHATKSDVRIYDYVDTGNPMLERMWNKRQRGYRAMGYEVAADAIHSFGVTTDLAPPVVK